MRVRGSVDDSKASSFGDKADKVSEAHSEGTRGGRQRRFLRQNNEAGFGLMVLGTSELPKW